MIFRFTMLSDESDAFLRVYQIDGSRTLTDLHTFICVDLGFDAEQMASFFVSDLMWEKLYEYTLFDMGGEGSVPAVPMEGVTLESVLKQEHDRLIYLFDVFGDRALYLELTQIEEPEPGVKYPRCAAAEGDAPGQFEAVGSEDEGSAFDEMMSDYGDFEGDENYQDDY